MVTMKHYKYVALFLLVIGIQGVFAQEVKQQDTLKKKLKWHKKIDASLSKEGERFSYSILPVISNDDLKGFEFGALSALVFTNDKTDFTGSIQRPSTLVPSILFSGKGFIDLSLDADLTFNRWNIVGNTSYQNFTDRFFNNRLGIVSTDEFTNYKKKFFVLNLDGFYRLDRATSVGANVEFVTVNASASGDENLSPELLGSGNSSAFGIGPLFKYDTRDHFNYPTKGILFQASSNFFISSLGGDFDFQNYSGDFRSYLPIRTKGVLAFQAYAEFSSGDVPFYKLPTLAGPKKLRGLGNPNQYIDKHVYFSQVEYRHDFGKQIGAVAFAGLGNSSNEVNSDLFKDIKSVYGLGLRFNVIPKQKLNLRFDYGFGSGNNNSFLIGISEAF